MRHTIYSKYLETNCTRRPLYPTERRSNVRLSSLFLFDTKRARPDDRHALNINPRDEFIKEEFYFILSISLVEEEGGEEGGGGVMEKEEIEIPSSSSSSINKTFSFDFDSVVRGRIFSRGVRGKSGEKKRRRRGEHLLSWKRSTTGRIQTDSSSSAPPCNLPSSFFVLVILFARIAKMRVTHAPFLRPSPG